MPAPDFFHLLDWKGLHLISHLFIDKLVKIMLKIYLKCIITYFSLPINLQNGRQQILYVFIFYIPALSLEKTMYGYPESEKKSGLRTKITVSTVDIWIKQSRLKVIHSKVPSSGWKKTSYFC